MKKCGRFNVRKHKEIKVSDKYVTLEISLKFDCLENMKIISSDSLITSLGFKAKLRPHKYKKARYAIINVRKKYLSNIIRQFEKCLIKVTRRRGPNVSLSTATFT